MTRLRHWAAWTLLITGTLLALTGVALAVIPR